MSLKPVKYVRKPFYIDAIQVTTENLNEVAKWCQGEVRWACRDPKGTAEKDAYVKVRVHRPLNERQTQAFVGDWVLYAGTGYKVYTLKAFTNSFEVVDSVSRYEMERIENEREAEAKIVREEKFNQIELTEKIEELMTVNQQAVLAPVEFKEA